MTTTVLSTIERVQNETGVITGPDPRSATVGTPVAAWYRMFPDIDLIDDLQEGTRRMQYRRTTRLPKYPREEDRDYDRRLDGAVLYPGFRDAVHRVAVKPFAKPVVLQEEERIPEDLARIAGDVDGEGTDLTHFARKLMTEGASKGIVHVLVDHPTLSALTAVEERESGVRPLFVCISAKDMIGWESAKNQAGERVLTQIRYVETRTVKIGEWGSEERQVVRVIDAPVANVPVELEDGTVEVGTQPGRWRVFEENPDKPGEFDLIEEGLHGFDGIPLVTLYFDRVGFMEGRPPFLDVAHLNLAHYRSTARQRQYLDVVRLAFLWGSGLSREELEQGITISPSRLAGSTKSGASMEWVEHTGAAASVGVEDLRDLEDKMLRLSLEPMQQRGGGNPTATGRAIEASKTQTDIEAWVRLVEAGIEMAYAMAAEWRSVELPEEFACDIWSDFALAMSKSEDIEQLVKMHVAGILSRETILQEIKRRGLLSDRVDVDEELQRVIDEAMAAQEAFDVDGDVGNDDPNPQGRPREPVAAGG